MSISREQKRPSCYIRTGTLSLSGAGTSLSKVDEWFLLKEWEKWMEKFAPSSPLKLQAVPPGSLVMPLLKFSSPPPKTLWVLRVLLSPSLLFWRFIFIYVCIHTPCVWIPKGFQILWSWNYRSRTAQWKNWGPNVGPLEKQHLLLTGEHLPIPQYSLFYVSPHIVNSFTWFTHISLGSDRRTSLFSPDSIYWTPNLYVTWLCLGSGSMQVSWATWGPGGWVRLWRDTRSTSSFSGSCEEVERR